MAKKYYNPIKEKLYEQYGHKFSGREQFNEIWKQTMYGIVGKFGFGRTKEKLSQQTALIMREDLLKERFQEKSLFYRIGNLKDTSAQDILKIERDIYLERTENFRNTYGSEIFYSETLPDGTINNITLEDMFQKFENGEISQEQMNNIIEMIKQVSKEYNAQEKYERVENYFK